MSVTLRGSLSAFPLDMLLAMLAEAKATGRLRMGGDAEGPAVEVTDGVPTGASSGALTGEAALRVLLAIEDSEFEFVPGPTGAPNLVIRVQELRARIGAAREKRAAQLPRVPGPATMRLRAIGGALAPLISAERTVLGIRVLGPEHPRPEPTPDPLWSPRHLAALLNAMLYLLVGGDAAQRTSEAEALEASARLKVLGVEGPLPMGKDGLDPDAMRGLGEVPWAVALLHAMIRELFEAADAVHEGSHVERGYAAAVEHTLGSDGALLRDALRLVGLARLRVRITVTSGGNEGPFHLEEREHAVGRSASNDVRLEHGSVSRRHARLVPRSGRYVLTDLGSTSGTAVNGERLTSERVLRSGDSITFGDVALSFEHVED